VSEFDELMDPAPKKRGRGRPSNEELAARLTEQERDEEEFWASPAMQVAMKAASAGNTLIDERTFHMPVTQNFLGRVLNIDTMTVNRRLRRLKPVGYAGGEKQKRPLYDFKQALEHLLKPKMHGDTFLSTLNPAEMPPAVNKTVWEAKRIKLKVELEAGQAWADADVLSVLGDVFMTIKSHTQLWVERLRERGMTDEQLKLVEEMTDVYCNELHEKLVDFPNKRKTRSRLAEIEREMMGSLAEDDE
jgi:hypothetical protein